MNPILASAFLSGSASLIYQIVWHRYLAILLGAQARATVLVLAIFLGGLSCGYYLFGKLTKKYSDHLWTLFALTEAGLGVWALLFAPLFAATYQVLAAGHLGNGAGGDIFCALLLLLPPTLLMGGTLPVLTQALSTSVENSSQTHSRIYGWNTLGAAAGCLLCGYVFLPELGLKGAMAVGALLNLGIAAFIYATRRKEENKVSTAAASSVSPAAPFTSRQLVCLAVAFLSGFCLISLETVFMRYLGMSTGAAHYNFTITVFIFVTALGIGSLTLKTAGITEQSLPKNLLFSALSLALVYLSVSFWPYWHHLLRVQFTVGGGSYYFFQLALGLGYSLILFVPLFLAGRTLPLCFHWMRDEASATGMRVGQLYAVNTLGCVLGAALGGYVLLAFVDLDTVFRINLVLLGTAFVLSLPRPVWWALALPAAMLFLPSLSPYHFLQPFRFVEPLDAQFSGHAGFTRYLKENFEYLHYKDDPDTSVGITRQTDKGNEVSRTIFVNGKSDSDTRGDIVTTLLLGHLPQLFCRNGERTAIIGFGTGVTVGAVAAHPEVKQIDVIEISKTIIEQAGQFDAYTGQIAKDRRVRFHQTDAFRFFQRSRDRFDVIISEPSNPYVNGVENLYTTEFYQTAKGALAEGGVFVQWIHTYSLNNDLLTLILRTIHHTFPSVRVFQLRQGDLALVATASPLSKEEVGRARLRADQPSVAASLKRLDIGFIETLLATEVMTPSQVDALARRPGVIHSLEFPTLNFHAAQARFQKSRADLGNLRLTTGTNRQTKDSLLRMYRGAQRLSYENWKGFKNTYCDSSVSRHPQLCEEVYVLGQLLAPDETWEPVLATQFAKLNLTHLKQMARPPSGLFGRAEKTALDNSVEWMNRSPSTLLQFPVEEGRAWFQWCQRTVSKNEALHGECLFHRLKFEDERGVSNQSLVGLAREYQTWFKTASPRLEGYQTLATANQIVGEWLKTAMN